MGFQPGTQPHAQSLSIGGEPGTVPNLRLPLIGAQPGTSRSPTLNRAVVLPALQPLEQAKLPEPSSVAGVPQASESREQAAARLFAALRPPTPDTAARKPATSTLGSAAAALSADSGTRAVDQGTRSSAATQTAAAPAGTTRQRVSVRARVSTASAKERFESASSAKPAVVQRGPGLQSDGVGQCSASLAAEAVNAAELPALQPASARTKARDASMLSQHDATLSQHQAALPAVPHAARGVAGGPPWQSSSEAAVSEKEAAEECDGVGSAAVAAAAEEARVIWGRVRGYPFWPVGLQTSAWTDLYVFAPYCSSFS